MSGNNNDEPVPQSLTDFVFDLYDSVTLSQLTEEQTVLYGTTFRDLSSKVSLSIRIDVVCFENDLCVR